MFIHHVHGIFDFNMQIPANALVMMALVGLSLCRAKEVGVVQVVPLPRLKQGLVSAAMVLMVLITFTTAWKNLRGAQLLSHGEMFSDAIEWELAQEELETAWAVDPQDYRIPMALGDLFRVQATWAFEQDLRQELYQKSKEWYARARDLNRISSEIVLKQAELETWSGNRSAAEDYYLEALSMDPHNAFLLTQYAIWLRTEDRTKEALEIFREVLQLEPEDAAAKANIEAIEEEMAMEEDISALELER
jgi:tetratricopeptide (TPR) repeat protein